MGAGFVLIAAGCEGYGQVDAECGLGTDEGWVVPGAVE